MRATPSRYSVLLAVCLLAAACGGGEPPDEATETPTTVLPGGDILACEVTDPAGVEDGSFNQLAYEGMGQAREELGVELDLLESTSPADFAPNIQALIDRDCDLIIAVGPQLGDAIETAASMNPRQLFAIVDFAYDPPMDNVLGLVFATDQAAFLAGFASASWSRTGVVGTFGGANVGAPVTEYMDGFYAGAKYHNEENGTDVEVLGWNPEAEDGLFTGTFDDQDQARRVAESLVRRGADVILPVADPAGQATAVTLQDSPEDDAVVGVNTDWCSTVVDACSVMLNSVTKNVDAAVYDAIRQVVEGAFEGGLYVGTLENGGVGLAGFHLYEGEISEETLSDLEEARAGIIDGSISTNGIDYL